MLIEALAPLRVKADGKRFALEPGQVVDLSPDCAARLLAKAPGKVRMVAVNPIVAMRPGSRITWQRADGRDGNGLIDFLHVDADGTLWAFCTCPDGGWVAVNTKYLITSEDSHG